MFRDTGSTPVYLDPGEAYFAREPAIVQTLLGSCVAVTLHSPVHCKGAICHALLPKKHEKFEGCVCGPRDCDGKLAKGALKFVDTAVQCMLGWFRSQGILERELEAKVFGGSVFYGGSAEASIGAKNAEVALALLEGTGIRVAAADVGGSLGRKIFFDTRTGAVRLKPLGAAAQSPGAQPGLEYRVF